MERRAFFSNAWLGYLLVLPQLVLIFVFFYWPAGEALFWAFTLEPPFGGASQWVGFQNFQQIFSDPLYWNSVIVSVIFGVVTTVLTLSLGLGLAMLVNRRLPGHALYRFLYFLPYAVAPPAVGLAFRFIFAPDAGFVSAINNWIPGFWNPAASGVDAVILIIIAFAWKNIGYAFIFFLAALQGIPRTLIEAGALDGAGVLRRFRDIELPLIMPTTFFLLVIMMTASLVDSFGIVAITTGGGPVRATNIMVYKIYSDGFVGGDYSLASAQSIVLMILVVALSIVQFRYIERKVHYN
jgi:sn-glycerol 3-phosphate transport system permease protein